jgi:hypothetical protein
MLLLEGLLVDPAGHQVHRTLMQERKLLLVLLLCLRWPLVCQSMVEKLVLQVCRDCLFRFFSDFIL